MPPLCLPKSSKLGPPLRRTSCEHIAVPSGPAPPPRPGHSDADADADDRTLTAEPCASARPPSSRYGLSNRKSRPRAAKLLYAPATNFDVDVSCWMSFLADHVRLDELYLAGTHDSLALHFPLLSSICQSTPLLAQLHGGIRFLDLRFALLDDGQLWAYHGRVPQCRSADAVFQDLYTWLESPEGARECVIVSCKQENPAPHFEQTLWALLDRDPRSRARWYDQDRWPSLGQVRGKCVMFCRFGWDSQRGLHPPTWPNDSNTAWRTSIGGRETIVQDWYGLSSPLGIPKKAALALSLFSSPAASDLPDPTTRRSAGRPPFPSRAAQPNNDPIPSTLPLRISFLSCASFPLLYPAVAAKGFGLPALGLGWRGVNELVLRGIGRLRQAEAADGSLLEKPPQLGCTYQAGQGGMFVLMDFWESPAVASGKLHRRDGHGSATGALVQEIIRMNFA